MFMTRSDFLKNNNNNKRYNRCCLLQRSLLQKTDCPLLKKCSWLEGKCGIEWNPCITKQTQTTLGRFLMYVAAACFACDLTENPIEIPEHAFLLATQPNRKRSMRLTSTRKGGSLESWLSNTFLSISIGYS